MSKDLLKLSNHVKAMSPEEINAQLMNVRNPIEESILRNELERRQSRPVATSPTEILGVKSARQFSMILSGIGILALFYGAKSHHELLGFAVFFGLWGCANWLGLRSPSREVAISYITMIVLLCLSILAAVNNYESGPLRLSGGAGRGLLIASAAVSWGVFGAIGLSISLARGRLKSLAGR